jgi:hypothetical protein
MPHIRVDADIAEEMFEEAGVPEDQRSRPPEGFTYEAAEAEFLSGALDPVPTLLLAALKGLGATTLRVEYDGGYDEGFAHFDYAALPDRRYDLDDLADKLAASPLIGEIKATAPRGRYSPYQGDDHRQILKNALDDLATTLACRLLGDGFGTGEYELYGAFIADLTTGTLTDDPAATPPSGGLG